MLARPAFTSPLLLSRDERVAKTRLLSLHHHEVCTTLGAHRTFLHNAFRCTPSMISDGGEKRKDEFSSEPARKEGEERRTEKVDDEQDQPLLVGDVVAEWLRARDRGDVPRERRRPSRRGGGRRNHVNVLFCDRDNRSSSVVAEAILSALVNKRGLEGHVRCFSAGTHVLKGSVGGSGGIVGIRGGMEGDGMLVRSGVVEELRHRWKIDVSRRMAVGVDGEDLGAYDYVCCLDEGTRSRVMYMLADGEGRLPDDIEERITVLSAYAKDPKWRSAQWRSGQYSKEGVKVLCQGIANACDGLLDFIAKDLEPN